MKKTFRKIINGSLLAIHVFLLLGFIGCIRAGAWVDALMAFILGIIPVVVYAIVNKDNSKNKEERDKFFCCPFCKAELELPERVKKPKS